MIFEGAGNLVVNLIIKGYLKSRLNIYFCFLFKAVDIKQIEDENGGCRVLVVSKILKKIRHKGKIYYFVSIFDLKNKASFRFHG